VHDLGRHRRTLDDFRRRAAFAGAGRCREGRRARRPDLPADFRQPCRLRQAGQSQRTRNARGGEHDFLDEEVKFYKDRYGKDTKGPGYYSFDAGGAHFIGLVNVVDLKAGGLGNLGAEQLEWLEDDLKGKSKSTPIVVFAHIPLWTVYPQWGWGTEDGAKALEYLKGFGSVTVLNGHIHQVMQKVEGNVTFHTARSTAFPQPAPGTAPSPGPMKVEDSKLRGLLGIASVNFKQGDQRLAIIDTPLQG